MGIRMRFSLILVALCVALFTSEADAGGHGNSNPTTVAADTTNTATTNAASPNPEVAGFAKKIDDMASKLKGIAQKEKKIEAVATSLNKDLQAAAVKAHPSAELGESGVLGTHNKALTIGESDLPSGDMRKLRDQ